MSTITVLYCLNTDTVDRKCCFNIIISYRKPGIYAFIDDFPTLMKNNTDEHEFNLICLTNKLMKILWQAYQVVPHWSCVFPFCQKVNLNQNFQIKPNKRIIL